MSLITMGTIAVSRDLTDQGQPLADGIALQRGATPAPDGGLATVPVASPASFGELLVAQIPTEALLGYTTLLALFAASPRGAYTTGRWALYAAAIVVCAVAVLVSYFAQKDYALDDTSTTPSTVDESGPRPSNGSAQNGPACRPRLPYLPVLTASLSMAVYGLAVPDSPLSFVVSPTAFAISSGCLAVGGGVMMFVFAPILGRGNAATATATATATGVIVSSAGALNQHQPGTMARTVPMIGVTTHRRAIAAGRTFGAEHR